MVRIKERRRRQRIDVALPIKIIYNKERIFSKTKNISVLGTYIETNKKIPVGVALDIQIKIPKRQIRCEGLVFRQKTMATAESKKRYGLGIFFRSFLKGEEKSLAKYIDYIVSQEKKLGKALMRKRRKRRYRRR